MRNAAAGIIAFSLVSAASAAGTGDSFDARARKIVDWVAAGDNTSPKFGFWHAQARFARGRVDEGRKVVSRSLDRLHDHDPAFQLWACMDCWHRWHHLYGKALRDKTRATMTATKYLARKNSSMTENKVLMLGTACYLTRLAWPDAKFNEGYREDDLDGSKFLESAMKEYVHRGEREHNSPTYYVHHYGPFRSIADFAVDREFKQKAFLTAEWLLAAAAPQWLDGHWVAPTRRIYRPFRAQNEYRAATILLWLYFGGLEPQRPTSEYPFAVQSALSKYRAPKIIVDIARDRRTPFTHREMHNGNRMIFYTTTYMTPEFGVFSMHEDIAKWPRYNNQVQRWGVCWRRGSGRSVFFVLHPTNTKVKNMGASQYEQTLQHEGTLLSVFDVPPDDPNPYLRGYIPAGARSVIDESEKGRVYLDYGNVMIAMHMTQGFDWKPDAEDFMTKARTVGLVVEVVGAKAYSGLPAFRAAVAKCFDKVSWRDAGGPVLNYASLDGTKLSTFYKGPDRVGKRAVRYATGAWPLLHNPWMHQAYDGDTLTIRRGGRTRVYDFKRWAVTER